MRTYESVILSTHLYGPELWPLTATSLKRLDGAYHRWQRSILSVSWKDKITNEEVRARTKQHSIAIILSERRLCWLGQCCKWITSTFHCKHYTGRFKASRGDLVGQGLIGEA